MGKQGADHGRGEHREQSGVQHADLDQTRKTALCGLLRERDNHRRRDRDKAKIAAKYGTTVDALAEINAIKNKNLIRVGQVLMLQDTPQAAADKLEALGVINSPDYWAEAAEAGKVQYLDILLKKAAQTITKAGVRTDTPQEGVAALVAAGVINTPEYWLANYGTFPSLDLLLQALGGAVK